MRRGAESEIEIFGGKAPRSFGDWAGEYASLIDGAGLLTAPWELVVEVTGADRAQFLQSMLTADIASLSEGRCVPAASADRKGHIQADLWMLHAGDRFLVRTRRDRWSALNGILDKHRITEDVHWYLAESPGEGNAAYLLLGPKAPAIAQGLGIGFEEGSREGGSLPPELGSGIWMRVREVSSQDFLFWVSEADPSPFLERVAALAEPPVPVGWDAFNLRRIECGTAWFGLDGDETRLVPELVPADRISLSKGCYLGQEPLARLHYQGQQNWRLSIVQGVATPPPDPGSDLKDPDGVRAGWLTSLAARPDGGFSALAYLHRRYLPGTPEFFLESGEKVIRLDAAEGSGFKNS